MYEWVKHQQLLLVHDDTRDDVEEVQVEELVKVGIDWENDTPHRPFSPTTANEAFHVAVMM